MYTRDFSKKSLREVYLIALLLVLTGIFILWSFRCLFIGKCYLTYDSVIAELGMCLDTEYRPVVDILQGTNKLFLCGVIDGVTSRPGSFYLFYGDKSLYTKNFHPELGIFYHPITNVREFEPGRYRIEIWYQQDGQRTKAQTEFEVIPR